MIQIRDVSDQVHGILKARAAREGISLSDFIKAGRNNKYYLVIVSMS